ncbi:hypothetical protein WA1_09845 [Scytonema hofmannii PCC 7110]|uniref:Uncharacterized protein n=2 Tax=Scytonema hofmannii TaxID=34078 RepID=A0A139WRH3_9CYAN|nr:hypothetical protein WA1_09845 [Scytonema hofmannii PCC 7110]
MFFISSILLGKQEVNAQTLTICSQQQIPNNYIVIAATDWPSCDGSQQLQIAPAQPGLKMCKSYRIGWSTVLPNLPNGYVITGNTTASCGTTGENAVVIDTPRNDLKICSYYILPTGGTKGALVPSNYVVTSKSTTSACSSLDDATLTIKQPLPGIEVCTAYPLGGFGTTTIPNVPNGFVVTKISKNTACGSIINSIVLDQPKDRLNICLSYPTGVFDPIVAYPQIPYSYIIENRSQSIDCDTSLGLNRATIISLSATPSPSPTPSPTPTPSPSPTPTPSPSPTPTPIPRAIAPIIQLLLSD